MPLPDREYFSLLSLAPRWGVEEDDVRYYAEHGELDVYCWLDRREVMLYQPQSKNCAMTCECRDMEGYVGIKPHDCRKIFRCGKYKLTNFIDLVHEGFEIVVSPQSRDTIISVNDLVVSKQERHRFEKHHGLEVKQPFTPCKARMLGKVGTVNGHSHHGGLYINRKKREYLLDGHPLNPGPIQSHILDQLADARSNNIAWSFGKTLLKEAGSDAVRMRDVFKSQPRWQELIESDKRGHYRIFNNINVHVA